MSHFDWKLHRPSCCYKEGETFKSIIEAIYQRGSLLPATGKPLVPGLWLWPVLLAVSTDGLCIGMWPAFSVEVEDLRWQIIIKVLP